MAAQRTVLVGWTTLPTKEASARLAKLALEKRLAACVQIDGPISSHYFWDGKMQADDEWRLTFKFSEKTRNPLKDLVIQHHDYKCPQWVVVPAVDSYAGYADWVDEVTGEEPSQPEPRE